MEKAKDSRAGEADKAGKDAFARVVPEKRPHQICLRFSDADLERLDRLAALLSRPGYEYNRIRIIRLALSEQLPRMEERERRAGAGRRSIPRKAKA